MAAGLTFMRLAGLLLTALAAWGPPASQRGADAPSIAEVEASLQAAEASATPEAAALAETYRAALAALQRAAESNALAARLTAEAAGVGAAVAALRDELAEATRGPARAVDPSWSLPDLEAHLAAARSDLDAARTRAEELVRRADERKRRKAELPGEIASAEEALLEARKGLAALPDGPTEDAGRTLQLARIAELEARLAALHVARDTLEVRGEPLPIQRDLAQRRVAAAERAVAFFDAQVNALRTAAGEAAAADAVLQAEDVVRTFPALADVAKRLAELAALRSGPEGLPRRIARARGELQADRALLEEVNRRYRSARRRVEVAGLSEAMGRILRRDREWLPSESRLRESEAQLKARLSAAQLQTIAIEEERFDAGDPATAVDALLDEIGADADGPLARRARALFEDRRAAQDAALGSLDELVTVHFEHQVLYGDLEQVVDEYRGYIEQRILWVESSTSPFLESLAALPTHALEVGEALAAAPLTSELRAAAGREWRTYVLGALFVALIAGRRLLRRKRAETGTLVRSFKTDRYFYTVRALVQTLLIALPLPLFAGTVGWLLTSSGDTAVAAVGTALFDVARAWLVLRFVRSALRDGSVALAHFRWPLAGVTAVRSHIRWLEPPLLALWFLVALLDRLEARWFDSLGRTAFVAAMLLLATFSHRLLRPASPVWVASGPGEGLFVRTRRIWSFGTTVLPIGLAVAAILGYSYTALQLQDRLRDTILLAVGLGLANGLLFRWLFMARRKLAVAQALEARARREEREEEDATPGESVDPGLPIDADKVDIPAVDAQTRRLFRSGLALATLVGLFLIWASVLPALQGLHRVQIFPELRVLPETGETARAPAAEDRPAETPPASGGQPTLKAVPSAVPEVAPDLGLPSRLTLDGLLLALVFLLLTLAAAKNLPALLELSILPRLPLDGGSRFAIATIVRYGILIAGVSTVSGTLGIGWSQIQWLAAALTFGLAFGLQEIFANFVSGLIILLERPIRVGDIVTVGNIEGRVTQLQMRATTIQDWDRREMLVPNKEFITGSVINWSLTDPVSRVVIPVGVAYGSNTQLAKDLLLKTAREVPLVMTDPGPQVVFRSFGGSSLDFELRVFIPNRDSWSVVVDQLHTRIDAAFREAGVEIAFPQRDVHVRDYTRVLEEGADAGPAAQE